MSSKYKSYLTLGNPPLSSDAEELLKYLCVVDRDDILILPDELEYAEELRDKGYIEIVGGYMSLR